MGVDIHFYITKYNTETNFFEEIKLYTRNKAGEYKKVPIFYGRNYDMFDILTNKIIVDNVTFPNMPIAYNSLEENIREKIKSFHSEEGEFTGCYDFFEVNLADLKNYLNTCPTMINYDYNSDEEESEDNKPYKSNVVKFLYDDIINYIKFADEFAFEFSPESYYKILYFFDC